MLVLCLLLLLYSTIVGLVWFGLVCCHFDGRYDHSVTHSLLLLVLLVILVCVTLHCSLDIAPRHMAL